MPGCDRPARSKRNSADGHELLSAVVLNAGHSRRSAPPNSHVLVNDCDCPQRPQPPIWRDMPPQTWRMRTTVNTQARLNKLPICAIKNAEPESARSVREKTTRQWLAPDSPCPETACASPLQHGKPVRWRKNDVALCALKTLEARDARRHRWDRSAKLLCEMPAMKRVISPPSGAAPQHAARRTHSAFLKSSNCTDARSVRLIHRGNSPYVFHFEVGILEGTR